MIDNDNLLVLGSKGQLNIPFLSMISEKSDFIEKLSFSEFNQIPFKMSTFSLIREVVIALTGVDRKDIIMEASSNTKSQKSHPIVIPFHDLTLHKIGQ